MTPLKGSVKVRYSCTCSNVDVLAMVLDPLMYFPRYTEVLSFNNVRPILAVAPKALEKDLNSGYSTDDHIEQCTWLLALQVPGQGPFTGHAISYRSLSRYGTIGREKSP